MTIEQEIIARFCWEHTEYATVSPSLKVNLWGDIIGIDFKTGKRKIIAKSNLHHLHADQLGRQLPTSWEVLV